MAFQMPGPWDFLASLSDLPKNVAGAMEMRRDRKNKEAQTAFDNGMRLLQSGVDPATVFSNPGFIKAAEHFGLKPQPPQIGPTGPVIPGLGVGLPTSIKGPSFAMDPGLQLRQRGQKRVLGLPDTDPKRVMAEDKAAGVPTMGEVAQDQAIPGRIARETILGGQQINLNNAQLVGAQKEAAMLAGLPDDIYRQWKGIPDELKTQAVNAGNAGLIANMYVEAANGNLDLAKQLAKADPKVAGILAAGKVSDPDFAAAATRYKNDFDKLQALIQNYKRDPYSTRGPTAREVLDQTADTLNAQLNTINNRIKEISISDKAMDPEGTAAELLFLATEAQSIHSQLKLLRSDLVKRATGADQGFVRTGKDGAVVPPKATAKPAGPPMPDNGLTRMIGDQAREEQLAKDPGYGARVKAAEDAIRAGTITDPAELEASRDLLTKKDFTRLQSLIKGKKSLMDTTFKR